MSLKGSNNHYGSVAAVLHWLMAILVIGLLALGLFSVCFWVGYLA
jgi:cytochrome b561